MPVSRKVWSALRWSGLPFLVRQAAQRAKVTILFYHDIDPSTLSHHLTVLSERYHFISLRDYVDARRSDSMVSLPKRALVVTFDDGLKGNFELAEVFRQHSVVPTVFLTSGIVGTNRGFWWTMVSSDRSEAGRLKAVPDSERVAALAALGHSETETFPVRTALSRGEIEILKESVDLQSHTVLHPILSKCSDERAWSEIAKSKADLESEHGLSVYALAYPNGASTDYGEREAAFAARAGYECAVTTVPGLNDGRTDLYRLRRIAIPDDASCDEVIVRASLLYEYLKRPLSFALHSRRAWGAR